MKIAVLESLGVEKELLIGMLKTSVGDSFTIDYYPDRLEDEESLIKRSGDADIVVLSNIPYSAEIMEKNQNLKMLCVAFTGVDHIDMDYCRSKGIVVSNASGYANTSVSELVFGLIISLYRKIIPCDAVARKGGTKDGLVGFELKGKKLGIVGLGAIGKNVASIGKAFGCEVYAYNRSPFEVSGVTALTLDELLKECDIISLHTPLTDETRGLIGKRELELMKRSGILINTARGPVVDNSALVDALDKGIIAGAGLDVVDMEPPIPLDYPLLKAKNTIITPHIAFATKESMIKRAKIVVENIVGWSTGEPQNIIN